jgi:hypothetical protein
MECAVGVLESYWTFVQVSLLIRVGEKNKEVTK